MCEAAALTMFGWAQKGVEQNGLFQLCHNGVLATTWCIGTWKTLADNQDHFDWSLAGSRISVISSSVVSSFSRSTASRTALPITGRGRPSRVVGLLPRQPHPQLWFTETTLTGVQPPLPPGPPPSLDSVEDQIPAQSIQQAGTTWRPAQPDYYV